MTRFGAAVLILLALHAGVAGDGTDVALRHAADAWDRGDYAAALATYLQLLDSPAAERVLEPIALQTGELFRTTELTRDGAAPQFSPDGRIIAYETGRGVSRMTRLIASDSGRPILTLQGHSASFSPDGSRVVYLKVPASDEIADAQAAARGAAGTERTRLTNLLTEIVGRTAQITVRDLEAGRETQIDTGHVRKASPVAAAGGVVVFVGWTGNGKPDQVYVVRSGAAPKALTAARDHQTIVGVNATGTAVLFTARRTGGAGRNAPARFGLLALPDAKVTMLEGTSPAFSGDGRSLGFISRREGEHRLNVAAVDAPEAATVIRKGSDPLDAPALSRDGSRLIFQMKPEEDWEVFLIDRDGSRETRVTREIQHDMLPRFLTSDRILATIGEARHRRSHIYDLASMTRTRIFHNNTVRTIAPEHAWVANPDGTKLLIVAERDGDTVSPERGVHLVDLTSRVTGLALRDRVAANLNTEQALRARASRLYAPIAATVRQVLAAASTRRVFDYEAALFDFDSKHITQPGNRRAAEYLFETYESFGYEPEYQWFSPRDALGGQTANVLATLKGTTNPELIYVVSSHYDTVATGPGADDNSSGTAALLETARILKDHPQAATIVFASLTGEEAGLLGSREHVRRALAENLHIVGALNNDTVGWANDHRLDNTIRYSNRGIRDVQHAAAMQFTKLITYDARYYHNTDAAAYYEAYGDIVGGIGSYPILGNPHYHQPHDLLHTINHQLVTEVARTTAATVMLLASSPSPVKDLKIETVGDGSATLSWTPSPERGVTGYLVTWGPAEHPEAQQIRVARPLATLPAAKAGTVVSVKAFNQAGLEGWDWARLTIE